MSNPIGGCLGKVDADRLVALLKDSGLGTASRDKFVDAELTNLPQRATSLATSIDLVYDFGLDPYDFGWIATVHALSDLYAVLASPLVATVCMGVPARQLSDGASAKILSGARAALRATGTALGGGHTVYADRAFVAVSAVGTDALTATLHPSRTAKYDLLLSKPLGSGIYIAAHRHKLLGAHAFAEVVEIMRRSNSKVASSLTAIVQRDPTSVGFVTDVTGFGLLIALHAKLTSGWRALLSMPAVPLLRDALPLLQEHGLSTSLGERNMLTVLDDVSVDLGTAAMPARLALSDPQTSGGLLAAVREDLVESLVVQQNCPWVRIGTVQAMDEAGPTLCLV